MIGITGSRGFLGWHLKSRLRCVEKTPFLEADRSTFEDEETLDRFTASCDTIFHLAGISRAAPDDVESGNIEPADRLIASLRRTGTRPHLVYANSIHFDRDTPYGRSKKLVAEKFQEWAASSGGAATNVVLPNTFGEACRPYYNSFVATFCDQLAHHKPLSLDADNPVELIHAQEAIKALIGVSRQRDAGVRTVRIEGVNTSVWAVASTLRSLHETYVGSGVIPDWGDPLSGALFNCLRHALFAVHPVLFVKLYSDPRGWLEETVRTRRLGQGFISGTVPGATRGNHLHLRKFERFHVVSGAAELSLRRLFDDQILRLSLSGHAPVYVDIPTGFTHAIRNVGSKELITVFWSGEILDPDDTDTYPEPVETQQ